MWPCISSPSSYKHHKQQHLHVFFQDLWEFTSIPQGFTSQTVMLHIQPAKGLHYLTFFFFPRKQNYLLCPNVNFLASLNMLFSPFHYCSLIIIQHWHHYIQVCSLIYQVSCTKNNEVIYRNNNDLIYIIIYLGLRNVIIMIILLLLFFLFFCIWTVLFF